MRLNTAAPADALTAFLGCCASHRWAQRLTAHRPYRDLETLLAAADEAAYDLAHADLTEALARESRTHPAGGPGQGYSAADTALSAAHAAYESRFGHAFVLCLDDCPPEETLDRVLAAIRTRLGHDPDDERAVTAEELRRLARGRLHPAVAYGSGGRRQGLFGHRPGGPGDSGGDGVRPGRPEIDRFGPSR